MSVFYYEPFYNLDRFLDHAISSRRVGTPSASQSGTGLDAAGVQRFLKPKMDLHEDSVSNTVSATFELPGIKKEDVSLEVQNGRLTVSAESSSSNLEGYTLRERRFGKFSRTLQLPPGVNDEQIKASMADGVLEISFPKTSVEASSKIPVA